MRSSTPPDLFGLCKRCWQREGSCLCETIPRVEPTTRILILRHAKETWRTSNTARLAELAIPGLEVIEIGAVPEHLSKREVSERTASAFEAYAEEKSRTDQALAAWLNTHAQSDVALLFPTNRITPESFKPSALIVPDGSWRQARRIVTRVAGLDRLPRLSLPPPPPAARLRRSPWPDGMSTIEAIATALAVLEGDHLAAPLRDLYARHVERQLSIRRRQHR